jgi:hypothetical protein
MNYTKGKWEAYKVETNPDRWDICAGVNGDRGIAKTILDNSIPPAEKEANANLISAAPEMYEALKELPEKKSLLSEAAYTGGDVSKKWVNDRGNYIEGYNQAIKDMQIKAQQALSKAEGKE